MYIRFDLKFFIFAFIFFISGNIKNYLLLMLFAVFHELGHIITGCILGLKVDKIEIMPVGLRASFKASIKDYNKRVKKANLKVLKKLILTIAGPMVNLVLIIMFILLGENSIIGIETETLIYINLVIFLFNMCIIYPLDGGRIFKYICSIFLGREKGRFLTYVATNVFTIIITLFIIYISFNLKNFLYIFVLTYIWIIVIRENKIYNIKTKIYKILKNNIAINKDS